MYTIHERKFTQLTRPFAIGCFYMILTMVFGSLTGGSFNSARIMGSMFFLNITTPQVFMLVLPLIGGVLGQLIYKYVVGSQDVKELFEDDDDPII